MARAKRAIVVLIGALAACGGAAQTDLFGNASGVDGGGVAEAGPDGSVSPPPGKDASPPPNQGDSSPPPYDSGTADADASGVDAADGSTVDPGIHCGNGNCAVGSEVCCRSGPTAVFVCTAFDKCNSGSSMPIPCDDSADCEAMGFRGDVCCATYSFTVGGRRVDEVVCRAPADCDPQANMVVVCSANDPSGCPSGTTCQANQAIFPGYDLCQ